MNKTLTFVVVILLGLSMISMFAETGVRAEDISWSMNPTPLPNPTARHSSIVHCGKIYVMGGRISEDTIVSNVYFATINPDGTVGSWSETTPLPEARIRASSVVWNNFIYVAGGTSDRIIPQNTVFYAEINPDGEIHNWNSALMPEGLWNHAAAVWNSRIYVMGGWNGHGRSDRIYIAQIDSLDGSIGSWIENPVSLPLPYEPEYALVHDGDIFLIGGWNGQSLDSVYHATIDETDGTIGSWESWTPLPAARDITQPVLIGSDIYVIGGRTKLGSEYIPHETVYRANLETETWQELQSIPEARMGHSVLTSSGGIYVIGGFRGYNLIVDTIYYTGEIEVISWEYIFEDPCRDTVLKVSTDDLCFQFIASERIFEVKHDPSMRICEDYSSTWITICYEDDEIKLSAFAVNSKFDLCVAYARDVQTSKRYLLIDRLGVE